MNKLINIFYRSNFFLQSASFFSKKNIDDKEAIKEMYRHFLSQKNLDREYFFVLVENLDNELEYIGKVSQGTKFEVNFDIQKLFLLIKQHNGASFYLAHNHPFGIAIPSEHDIQQTSIIKRISNELSLNFKDHFILARSQYFSFRAEGLMKDGYSFTNELVK